MCQGKQDQHIKNCPFYISFLKKIFKKIVSIVVKQNASERRKENQ
jgi:hypothetical protein